MTREDAFAAALKAVENPPQSSDPWRAMARAVVIVNEALGLIEFTRAPTEDELRQEALGAAWRASGASTAGDGPAKIEAALARYGFYIVRDPGFGKATGCQCGLTATGRCPVCCPVGDPA